MSQGGLSLYNESAQAPPDSVDERLAQNPRRFRGRGLPNPFYGTARAMSGGIMRLYYAAQRGVGVVNAAIQRGGAAAAGAAASAAGRIQQLWQGSGNGQNIALGLSDDLETFAARTGSTTWRQWAAADPLNWKSSFFRIVGNGANRVNFNLTGVDSPWASVARAARGAGGATDWELLQIQQNPAWWNRVTFWNNGQVVPNPFR